MGYYLAKMLKQKVDDRIAIAVESIAQNLCMKFIILRALTPFVLIWYVSIFFIFSSWYNTTSASNMPVSMPKTARRTKKWCRSFNKRCLPWNWIPNLFKWYIIIPFGIHKDCLLYICWQCQLEIIFVFNLCSSRFVKKERGNRWEHYYRLK